MSKKTKLSFSGILENNTALMIISLITATLIWYSVAFNNQEAKQTIRNIPVSINISDSSVERLGLEPVMFTQQVFAADVAIIGAKATVGNITADDILVQARLSNVTGPGTFDLVLEAVDTNNKNIMIEKVYPETISLRFDHFIEKTFPVTPHIVETVIPDGYILGKEYVYPSEVTVRGPTKEIGNISSALAMVNLNSPLSSTTSFETSITLHTENGELVESQSLELSETETSVTLPVFKKKILPITFGFSNVPAGFDIESLNYIIDPVELELAGSVSTIDNMTELNLGYTDLKTLTPNETYDYETPLPTGYLSIEGIQEITVSFENEDYGEKVLAVSDIRLINVPSDYDIKTKTKTIYNVTIYGPEDQLEVITSAHLVAQIDMSNVDLKAGTATVPVSILIPGFDSSWAYGNEYSAVIDVSEK